MKKVLVFGGTRFFGKKVVEHFLGLGYDVTIATRGISTDDLGTRVERIIIDRSNKEHVGWETVKRTHWDIVFDNICYTWQDAQVSLSHLKDVGHYLLTSSMAIYEGDSPATGFTEQDFNPKSYSYDPEQESVSYGEGKRQAETFFEKNASFPTTYLRFPVVLDTDDYTERLKFYVDKIESNEPVVFRRDNGLYGFVEASEIPLVLTHLMKNHLTGAYNIASTDSYSFNKFIAVLEEQTHKKVIYQISTTEKASPFSTYDSVLNVEKLIKSGYHPSTQDSWLPELVTYYTH